MNKNKMLKIITVFGSVGLIAGCNSAPSGSGGNKAPNPPSPNSNEIKVPISQQVGTPISIHAKSQFSATKSIQERSLFSVGSDNCLKIVETNGKTYTSEITSSPYWSTAKINFEIQNTCSSPTSVTNASVIVDGFNIDGVPVKTFGEISQSGSGPYMAIKHEGNEIILNTPECSSWCDWAQLPANSSKKFTITNTFGSAISSVNVKSIAFNGAKPPQPSPEPTPEPVDKTGGFTLNIDASALKDKCVSAKNCSATINVGVPSGQSELDSITFNPAESQSIERVYSNLLPGNYTLQVNNGNLPKGTEFNYGDGNGTINVAAGSKSQAQVNFKYSEIAEISNINFSVSGISDLSKFVSINSVEADITDETSGKVYKTTLPLNGNVSLNGIPTQHTYTIKTQSIGNPEEGIFYEGANLTGVKFNAGDNTKALTFKKVTKAPNQITFNVSGLEAGNNLSVILADSGDINKGFYVYTPAKNISDKSVLKFVDGAVAINVETPSGYKLNSDYQKVISGSATINLSLTKDDAPPVVSDKISATYWALWGSNTSYPIDGNNYVSKPVNAQDIDKSYNLIIASFIVTDPNGNYILAVGDPGKENSPKYYTDAQIIDMVNKVKEQKRKIIISLGGEHFTLAMKTPEDKTKFVQQVKKIVDQYGFEGIDLDLEQGVVGSADPELLAQAVNEVTNYYRNKGQDFVLTMAPEWGHITPMRWGCGQWASGDYSSTFYIRLVKAIGVNNITYVMPQTYNQGPGNGVCDNKGNKVVPAQMDKFLASMAWAVTTEAGYKVNTTGTNGDKMPIIPPSKFILGIPATLGAAGSNDAYVATPAQISSTWNILVNDYGVAPSGFFTWAADWDATPYENSKYNFKHNPWDTGRAIYQAINSKAPPKPEPEQCSINTTFEADNSCFCQYHPADSKCGGDVPPGPNPNPNGQQIVGYWASWSTTWGDANTIGVANIPSYVSRVLISFVQPSCVHSAGKLDCGLQFSMDMATVRGAIDNAHKKNPNQKFLLSIGGANYPFSQSMTQQNADSLVALMTEIGADGLDVDYETQPNCTGLDTAQLKCNTDAEVVHILNLLRNTLPKDKMLTAATWSVGAYGNDKFPVSKYLPISNYAGMFVNPLKQAGNKLDEIYIMSYDAGNVSNTGYNPKEAFTAYSDLFPKQKVFLGLEIPNEAWGDNILTVSQGLDYANYVATQGGGGVMLWSLNKLSNVNGENANDYLKPICNSYGFSNCAKDIPIK